MVLGDWFYLSEFDIEPCDALAFWRAAVLRRFHLQSISLKREVTPTKRGIDDALQTLNRR